VGAFAGGTVGAFTDELRARRDVGGAVWAEAGPAPPERFVGGLGAELGAAPSGAPIVDRGLGAELGAPIVDGAPRGRRLHRPCRATA
jgi:hypothetical protein